ncbi:hypothetical protein Anas_05966 [Armadillidium nasatum]|uniref:Uncharacterized protein n=1 Tax=Armadillidium nasatum TaxID=96803 RepID=A0A5N5T9W4_9CRUS|nr:hypothetical protein Anas_05966 [Armadillidium nasatum]
MSTNLGYLVCISFVILIYGQSCESKSLKRDLGSGVGPLPISKEIKKMLKKRWYDEETNEITEEDYEEVYDDLKDYLTDETEPLVQNILVVAVMERKLEVLQNLYNLKEKIKKDEKPKSRSEGKFFFTIKSLRNFPTKDLLGIFESSVSELNNCG